MFITQTLCVLEGVLGKEEKWSRKVTFIVLNLQIHGPARKLAILKENNSDKKERFET